jgi:ribosomal protein S18 acetylase RimI-like enzyme
MWWEILTMNKAVRRVGEADAKTLSLLNTDVQNLHASALPERFKPPGPDTFSEAAVRTLLANPNNLIFIAEVDSEPAGYAYAEIVRLAETPIRRGWDEVHLHHLSVRPAFRRMGFASALLDAVRAAAGEIGIDLLTLQVWTFNEDAQAFFRRQGFTPYMARLWNRKGP